uniref:glycerate kinase n=1 Tax=uncultured Polaribacter sp. TaxID=174711 RepID=UPI00259BE2FD
KGVKNIILGIGGTASNDCGIGMASALGYQFLDKYQNNVKPVGANLARIRTIDDTNVMPKLKEVTFTIACDVVNPLFGENGAAHIYAAQKGATKKDIVFLDKGLQCFAQILTESYGVDVQSIKGAGAAGGLGIAAKLFLKGTLKPGIEIIKKIANFDEQISNADWIITGEGKLDHQTLSGKTIQGVLGSAKKQHIKVAAFCGSIDLNQDQLSKIGITHSDDIMSLSNDFEDALQNSNAYLSKLIDSFAKKFIESTRFNNK